MVLKIGPSRQDHQTSKFINAHLALYDHVQFFYPGSAVFIVTYFVEIL